MKSVCRNGIRSPPPVFSKVPWPKPVPPKPPFEIEYSAWMIWYPLPSASFHGSIQTETRSSTRGTP